jgi:DinB superfamily
MAIVPDTKDWTWVLREPCPECRFDGSTFPANAVPRTLRDNALAWQDVLAGPQVSVRPAPDRWSDLEYGCHVRDVFCLYDERLHLMLTDDDARFANWDQDATAVEGRYGEQDPATVAAELLEAGNALAASLDEVQGAQWDRTGARSDGAQFTVDSFARYLVHDAVHHLWDVTGDRAGGSVEAGDAYVDATAQEAAPPVEGDGSATSASTLR